MTDHMNDFLTKTDEELMALKRDDPKKYLEMVNAILAEVEKLNTALES